MALSGTIYTSEDNGANLSLGSPARWPSYYYLTWSAVQDIATNTSTISWALYGGSNYQNVSAYVSSGPVAVWIDGTQVFIKNGRFDLHKGDLVGSGVVTVRHDAAGDRSVKISISGAIYSYASNCIYEGSIELDRIPRAAELTYASNGILGGLFNVQFAPKLATHYLWFLFTIPGTNFEKWSERIYPGSTDAQNLNIRLPEASEAAMHIAGNLKEACMCVSLYTYSDINGAFQIGAPSVKYIDVTIPDDESTKPGVSGEASPVGQLSEEKLYIQGVSKVYAEVTGTEVLGSAVSETGFIIDGTAYQTKSTSNVISQPGNVKIEYFAINERGFVGKTVSSITVQPHTTPRIKNVQVFRCDENGVASESGAYLRIKAKKVYSPVEVEGKAHNSCALSYKIRQGYGNYGEEKELLAANSEYDDIDTGKIDELNLDPTETYKVMLIARDTLGSMGTVEIVIPSEKVYRHRPAKGNGMGLGKYVKRTDALEVAWDIYSEKDVVSESESVYPHRLSHALQSMGFLQDENLDEFTQPGIWRIGKNYNLTGLPDMETPAYLIVLSPFADGQTEYGRVCLQIVIDYSSFDRKIRSIWYGEVHEWNDL